MPRTKPTANKKNKRSPRSPRKTISANQPKEPVYINVNEHQADLTAKTRILWLIVGIFAIILICGWLIILRANLKGATSQAGWSKISQEISDSLARFDTEIKNRSQIQPLSADDLSAIKADLEQRIKNNPDSSDWPTHELGELGLSVQYPADWQKISESKTAAVLTDLTATSSLSTYGRIALNLFNNAKKYNLTTWQTKNKIDLTGYVAEKPLFVFSSTTAESLIYNKNASTGTLDRLIYLDFPAQKMVLEIKATARGDNGLYQPLIDEIVRTIKIIK